MKEDDMNILIVGPGALGTLLGAYLNRGGADVTLVGRTSKEAPPKAGEVEVRTFAGETFRTRLQTVYDPGPLEDVDIIIVCVKTFQTEAAVAPLVHLRERVQAVVSFQNGVEKDLILERHFGKDTVIGGCCGEAAARADEGTILHTMSMGTYLGEFDGSRTPRVEELTGLLQSGGLPAEARSDVLSVEWGKWINFAAIAAICALTRLPYHQILQNPSSADLIAQIYREYAELAEAHGIDVHDYPGFEVQTISQASRDEAIRLLRRRGEDLVKKAATKIMPSLARDLIAGRPTERESIFGFAVHAGDARDVPMTFTRYAYALITAIEEGGRITSGSSVARDQGLGVAAQGKP
jgi:2-dehydropantoate 2-reductase